MKNDILADRPELKKMPYKLTEGYFEGFKMDMKPCMKTYSPWKRALPFVSAAASLALLLASGFLLSQHGSRADEFTHEDFLVFSDSMIATEYYEYTSEQFADAEMADDDIIDYLIYSGITAEEIEEYNKQ